MLYRLLKCWVRLGLPLFARRIDIYGRGKLAEKGPLLLAVNHPNSFLDAILLGAFMHHPVHFHTRGDVFRKAWVRRVLSHINMLPVYRMRDGKHKLSLNQQTFEKSEAVLESNGILLVFVEGFCEYQTTLQLPLKKGAPRVVDACWRKGIPVKILPVWLRYSSFHQHPKEIEIRLGDIIERPANSASMEPAFVWQKINEQTATALARLEKEHSGSGKKHLNGLLHSLLMLPALLGAVLHAPLYLPARAMVRHFTKGNVHYDSVLIAVLLLVYPLYLLLAGLLLAAATQWYFFFLPVAVLPLLARVYVLWKRG